MNLLKMHRERAGLTQAELAKKAGLSLSLVRQIETGARHITRKTAMKVSSVLSCDPAQLMLDGAGLRPIIADLDQDALAIAIADVLRAAQMLSVRLSPGQIGALAASVYPVAHKMLSTGIISSGHTAPLSDATKAIVRVALQSTKSQ